MKRKRKPGRPEIPNAYNQMIGVMVNGKIRRALRSFKMSESGAARGLIIAALVRDGLITKDDLPHT
jgi:hypothetical protein